MPELLPSHTKPSHYAVLVFDIDVPALTFAGEVRIDIATSAPTSAVSLHIRDLTISSVKLELEQLKTKTEVSGEVLVTGEVATITFPVELPAQSTLVLAYTGLIQTNMAGFYRSTYDGDKVMLTTQFEATDARRAFPCFDEPALKATFAVLVEAPAGWTVLSNMPAVLLELRELGKKGPTLGSGSKVVTFATTPVMLTYLVAWALGEFEYVETHTEALYNQQRLPVRVYTTKGLSLQAQFALDVAAKVVDFFSHTFDIPYALPKLDLVAVHEFLHGAMENWGLVTFRATALLFDDATLDPAYAPRVAYVVAHELAHQWFGNLVTMQWWDELWLNEGFATYAGTVAVDRFFPQWRVFDTFVGESLQGALSLDALRGSHPVHVPVHSALDIDQVFDAILYLKGASVLRMVAGHLTPKVFFDGVSAYLKEHAYGNATTKDLFRAWGEASGEDVEAMLANWIGKIGYPLVEVRSGAAGWDVSQRRFLATGDATANENTTVWWVPLNPVGGSASVLSSSAASIPAPLKLNKDLAGVFRVYYDDAAFATVLANIASFLDADIVGLVADAGAAAAAGEADTRRVLQLAAALTGSDSTVVWAELIRQLSAVQSAWYKADAAVRTKLQEFARGVYAAGLESVGLESASTDSFLTTQRRAKLLQAAGLAGVPAAVAYAREVFASWRAGGAIPPALRAAVLSTVLAQPEVTSDEVAAVWAEVQSPSALDSKEIALGALGWAHPSAKATEYIATAPIMDVHFLTSALAANTATRDALWEYIQAHYDELYAPMLLNMVVLDRFVRVSLGHYADADTAAAIRGFFERRNTKGFERSLSQVLDKIATNAKWVGRGLELDGW